MDRREPRPAEDEDPTEQTVDSAIGARIDLGQSREIPEQTVRANRPEPDRTPASFWRRLGAYLADAVLLAVATNLVTTFTLGPPPADVNPLEPAALETLWPYYAVNAAIAWLYFAGFESSTWQATVGKRLLSLQVTDDAGARLSFWRASARYFGKIASALPLGLGFLMIFTTERNQALHDKLASCLVLESRDEAQTTGTEWER